MSCHLIVHTKSKINKYVYVRDYVNLTNTIADMYRVIGTGLKIIIQYLNYIKIKRGGFGCIIIAMRTCISR